MSCAVRDPGLATQFLPGSLSCPELTSHGLVAGAPVGGISPQLLPAAGWIAGGAILVFGRTAPANDSSHALSQLELPSPHNLTPLPYNWPFR